jgi:hypothetical protein
LFLHMTALLVGIFPCAATVASQQRGVIWNEGYSYLGQFRNNFSQQYKYVLVLPKSQVYYYYDSINNK